jgi:hypothetical protein
MDLPILAVLKLQHAELDDLISAGNHPGGLITSGFGEDEPPSATCDRCARSSAEQGLRSCCLGRRSIIERRQVKERKSRGERRR